MMLLLADFFGVCDVSWVPHQSIDGFQTSGGRIFMQATLLDLCHARSHEWVVVSDCFGERDPHPALTRPSRVGIATGRSVERIEVRVRTAARHLPPVF